MWREGTHKCGQRKREDDKDELPCSRTEDCEAPGRAVYESSKAYKNNCFRFTKKKVVQTSKPQTKKVIKGLPGKKTASTPALAYKKTFNKCKVCSIIYDGKADKAMQKKVGKLKWAWVGCDADGCDYWAHAVCAGIKISKLKELPTLKFLCPEHKQ